MKNPTKTPKNIQSQDKTDGNNELKILIALTREAVINEYEKYLHDYKEEVKILKEQEIYKEGQKAERQRNFFNLTEEEINGKD